MWNIRQQFMLKESRKCRVTLNKCHIYVSVTGPKMSVNDDFSQFGKIIIEMSYLRVIFPKNEIFFIEKNKKIGLNFF